MGEEKTNLKIEMPFGKFQEHLELEDNHRIIFSGIFGIGKTTFIRDFFTLDAEEKKNYEAIHLFPVNYSVANNEDIFELVKFDILLQLLTKDVVFDKIDVGTDLILTQFVKDNFVEVLSPFLNFIPVVGGSLSKITDKLIKLRGKYEEYENKIKTDELEIATKFLNEFTKIKGSLYEEDFYSNLIQDLISQLRDKGKEVILIIDDLDRIDPEHIFRLLNIFAAHIDTNQNDEKENKFGFDKVIFVCDIDNIRNIYKHKYGIETDFNGYIDKFYSREIFKFNAEKVISDYVSQILSNIKVTDSNQMLHNYDGRNTFDMALIFILHTMLLSSSINLRDLFRNYNRKDLVLPNYNFSGFGYHHIHNTQLDVTQLFDTLKLIFGNNVNKILIALDKCKLVKSNNNLVHDGFSDRLLANLILFLDMNTHRFKPSRNNANKIFIYKKASYEIQRSFSFKKEIYFGDINNFEEVKEELNYFELLYECFVMINQTIKQ